MRYKVVIYQLLQAYVIASIVCYALGTLSKKPKQKRASKNKLNKVKLATQTVTDRGLVVENVEVKDITENYQSYCERTAKNKSFDSGSVLGFVTPWNSHGYDVAKTFKKFDLISPVWLQIKRKPRGKFILQGTHDVDKGWVGAVRSLNRDVQIVPRVLFDSWREPDFKALFASEDEIEDMILEVTNTLHEFDFDGMVLELWSQLPGYNTNKKAIHLIKHISEVFRQEDLMFILVIPPPLYFEGKRTSFGREEFEEIAPLVDAFSLMTYDYMATAPPGRAGPTAPLVWVESCVTMLDPESRARDKILLGINLYGYLYGKLRIKAVVGTEYIQMLKSRLATIEWNKDFGEHVIMQDAYDGSAEVIFYPTLLSIQKRIDLARQLGTGLAIWDLGQGLDYFYDLL